MEVDSIKVFQPHLWVKLSFASVFILFQIFILYPIFNKTVNFGVNHIGNMVFMGFFSLVALFTVLRVTAEKILITHNAIVIVTLFRNQTFELRAIKLIKKVYVGRGNSALLIETNQSVFKVGKVLTESQVNEAVAYTLAQIRVNYPETYALMKDDRSEVKTFWSK